LVLFRRELGTHGCKDQLNIQGTDLLASLMPKYCEVYRKLQGETRDVHQISKEEDEIIRSFFANIDSLEFLLTASEVVGTQRS